MQEKSSSVHRKKRRAKKKPNTHEFLLLAAVLDADVRLAALAEDGEGEVLAVRLHLRVLELTPDEALGVEHGVVRVHGDLVLRGVADQALVVREGHIRGRGAVALVVGDDLNAIVLPDTDTSKAAISADFFRDKTMTYEYVVPRSIPIAFEEEDMVDVCWRWWGEKIL